MAKCSKKKQKGAKKSGKGRRVGVRFCGAGQCF
jgi:hypothetical protein